MNGEAPFVNFYNGNYGYWGAFNANTAGDRQALGNIGFLPKDSGQDDSLRFHGFSGGIYIVPGPDAVTVTRPYLIGWEKVDLSTTEPFDTQCQYRVLAGGTMYNIAVVGNLPDNANQITNGLQATYAGGVVGIWQYDKTGLWHRYHIDQDTTSDPWTRSPGNADWKIEKLCLPSYNPLGV